MSQTQPLTLGTTYTFAPPTTDGGALLKDGLPWNLTAATVTLRLTDQFGASTVFPAVIVDAAAGTVTALVTVPAAGVPGLWIASWVVAQGGQVETIPGTQLKVTAQ